MINKSFLILLFLLNLTLCSAQSKDEPNAKETFDFITYFITNRACDLIDNPESPKREAFNILEKDSDKQIIIFEDRFFNGGLQTWKIKTDLNKLKDAKIEKIWKYDHYLKDLVEDGYWGVAFYFKENSVIETIPKSYDHPSGGVYNKTKDWKKGDNIVQRMDSFTFILPFDEKENAEKLQRAALHLIKINTGVNPNLFN